MSWEPTVQEAPLLGEEPRGGRAAEQAQRTGSSYSEDQVKELIRKAVQADRVHMREWAEGIHEPSDERKVKLSVEVTPELNQVVERIAALTGSTKSEAVRKAIVLLDVAMEAKGNGERLFVGAKPPPGPSREIVGL